jgi:colicin import membrane protein
VQHRTILSQLAVALTQPDAAARKQKEKEDAEAARKQKEKDDAEAARKQKEREDAEAARKAKEKEEAARKERERQRKEQEDRIKKMAKELEIKEQTEDLKRRILKNADVEITALETATNLVAKISDKYALSIQAAIRPNITFDPDSIVGNPAVEIQIGLIPDGTIVSIITVKPSGNKSWDIAAARALDKTERLPKDENGRVPTTLSIVLRPRER